MENRYVYPTTWMGKEALEISDGYSDGKVWFGTSTAIRNYCKENGIKIKDIQWNVKFNIHSFGEYEPIIASTAKEWKEKYDNAKLEFNER